MGTDGYSPRGAPTNRAAGMLQGAPSRGTAGDQQAFSLMTEWARCLPCSWPGAFYIRVLEPRLTMHLGEERAEKGGQRHGAPTLLRGLEEEVRRGAERVLPCLFLLHLRGAAAGQTRGSRTKRSGACDSGHLQGASQGPTQGTGYLGSPGLQPLSQCSRDSEISRLEAWLPWPGLVDKAAPRH